MQFTVIFVQAFLYLINIIEILVFIRLILSWLPMFLNTKFGSVLVILTEPFLSPARRLFFKIRAFRDLPVDFSPLLVILVLEGIRNIILAYLR